MNGLPMPTESENTSVNIRAYAVAENFAAAYGEDGATRGSSSGSCSDPRHTTREQFNSAAVRRTFAVPTRLVIRVGMTISRAREPLTIAAKWYTTCGRH